MFLINVTSDTGDNRCFSGKNGIFANDYGQCTLIDKIGADLLS